MPFTNTWSEIVPADTQAAALLANNIRNLKTDLRQRMVAFAAGPIASRETPEAIFGTSTTGVLFFSTDESKVYRWNGAAWLDVTNLILGSVIGDYSDIVPVVVTNPGAPTNGVDVTIPAASLLVGSIIEIVALVRITAGTGVAAQTLVFGATVIGSVVLVAGGDTCLMYAQVQVTGAATQKSIFSSQNVTNNPAGTNTSYATPTEAISGSIIVKTVSAADPAMTISHEFMNVRVRR